VQNQKKNLVLLMSRMNWQFGFYTRARQVS